MPIRANITYRGISFRVDQPGSVVVLRYLECIERVPRRFQQPGGDIHQSPKELREENEQQAFVGEPEGIASGFPRPSRRSRGDGLVTEGGRSKQTPSPSLIGIVGRIDGTIVVGRWPERALQWHIPLVQRLLLPLAFSAGLVVRWR